MTFAIISDVCALTAVQFVAARELCDAALISGFPVHVAEPAADGWRGEGNGTSPAVMGVLFQSAAPLIADIEEGDPSWEDAEWQ